MPDIRDRLIVNSLRIPMYEPNPMVRGNGIYEIQCADAQRALAADEIERLRAALRRIIEAWETSGDVPPGWSGEIQDAIDAAKEVLDA